jgi:hypothetical protein
MSGAVSLSSVFGSPTPDYSGQFNTQLTPEQEAAFQAQFGGRLNDLRDYDLRGAFLANAQAAANGHLPDTFKKPNHPTFSTGSQYATPDQPGGVWAQMPNQGPWTYTPSATNLNLYGAQNLQNYMADREPGALLLGLPPQTNPTGFQPIATGGQDAPWVQNLKRLVQPNVDPRAVIAPPYQNTDPGLLRTGPRIGDVIGT